MTSFSQRTLSISLAAIAFIFLTVRTLTPLLEQPTLLSPSPFTQTPDQPPHQLLCQRPQHAQQAQQQGPLSHQAQHQQQQPTWLIATISAYHAQRRRNIIRATWQTLYADPAITTRFVLAKPTPLWQPLIEHENDTYGDLTILETLDESAAIANTIKTIEYLKHLTATAPAAHPRWKYISKIDDDSYLSARQFHRQFLLPLLTHKPSGSNSNSSGTLIARRLTRPDRPFSHPGGQFYTLSHDLATLVATLHARTPIRDLPEDVLVGRLLHDAGAAYEFVELDDTRAFDVTDDLSRLSKEQQDIGPMTGAAINPHKMKDDEMYLRVAGLFDKDGFVGGGGEAS